jgi:hypothetical protein
MVKNLPGHSQIISPPMSLTIFILRVRMTAMVIFIRLEELVPIIFKKYFGSCAPFEKIEIHIYEFQKTEKKSGFSQ